MSTNESVPNRWTNTHLLYCPVERLSVHFSESPLRSLWPFMMFNNSEYRETHLRRDARPHTREHFDWTRFIPWGLIGTTTALGLYVSQVFNSLIHAKCHTALRGNVCDAELCRFLCFCRSAITIMNHVVRCIRVGVWPPCVTLSCVVCRVSVRSPGDWWMHLDANWGRVEPVSTWVWKSLICCTIRKEIKKKSAAIGVTGYRDKRRWWTTGDLSHNEREALHFGCSTLQSRFSNHKLFGAVVELFLRK